MRELPRISGESIDPPIELHQCSLQVDTPRDGEKIGESVPCVTKVD
jgi:hypothetical protein